MSYATLMVCCDSDPRNDNRLHVAANLAERFDARVIGIAAQEAVPVSSAQGDAFGDVDTWAQNQANLGKRLQLVEEHFRNVLKGRAREIDWRSDVTDPVSFIAAECRAADLVITGNRPDDTSLDPADLVMWAGRPLLVIPNNVAVLKAERILVAWKDAREARRAICDALPLLRLCQKAIVAQVDEDQDPAAASRRVEDVVAWLECHDVKATAWTAPVLKGPAAQLDALAVQEGLDLIVAGAYGHGKVREWVFGGVTHDLLQQTSRCQFFSH
ncbi:MAG TPA: universal stress protein [Methylocella sp.]|nr:universal stress protein [Methylocella sp.]